MIETVIRILSVLSAVMRIERSTSEDV